MAQKNILNKVKTAQGYDTLYPLTPHQMHYATNVAGDGANYNITIDLPAENINSPIIVCFTPNISNQASCTVQVNGLATKPLNINNTSADANVLDINTSCLVLYDINESLAKLIGTSKTQIPANSISPASIQSGYGLVPAGLISMWSGTTIPSGWHLCDGTNGTPDLRDRFVVGSGGSYSVGSTGGESSHTLTIAEMPSHNHYTKVKDTPIDTSDSGTGNILSGEIGRYTRALWDVEITTSFTGSGQAYENRPPYYALAYIMKIQ